MSANSLSIEQEQPLEIVARHIGTGVTGEDVGEFLDLAKEQQLLLHGVKRASYVPSVKEHGILPLTPEGGSGSYWATGNQIFYIQTPTPDSGLWAYNTAFFHYAGAYNPGGRAIMALAVTDIERLGDQDITPTNYQESGECVVKEAVGPSLLTIITAEGEELSKRMFVFLLEGAGRQELLQSGIQEI
jgi:hypothetical protein